MKTDRTVMDKEGKLIGIHELRGNWKITPFQRDVVYQAFLRAFPDQQMRFGICKEQRNDEVMKVALEYFEDHAKYLPITADRIHHFVSQAVASEAGYLPKSERWDWWVGCSNPILPSAVSAPLR